MTYMELDQLSTEQLLKVKEAELARIESSEQARQYLIKGILFLQTIEDQRSKDNGEGH